MRNLSRTMIGLLLGAALMAPVAAQAQDSDQRRGGWQRGEGRPGPVNNDARREAIQQGREAPRAVERPAPMMRPQLPAAAADAARQGGWRDRVQREAPRDAPARTWERPRGDLAGNNVAVNRDRSDRRDWDRDGNREGRRDWNRDGNKDGRRWDRTADRDRDVRWDHDRNRRGDNDRRWTSDRRDWDGRNWDRRDDHRWDRDWRQDRRYSWQDYRRSHRNVYRLPRYESRYGFSYRRWYPGYRFDPWFYGSSYWIDDPWYYRLPPAYGDYRWIRYYDDVALVDIRTGLIVDIIYSFFL